VRDVSHPDVRASDEDRARVAAALERHTAEGRLSLDEFTDRVGKAYLASTHGDLARLTHDLPAAPPPPAPPRRDQRALVIAMVLAMATIAALAIVLALFKH
jgi:hypothetical protein